MAKPNSRKRDRYLQGASSLKLLCLLCMSTAFWISGNAENNAAKEPTLDNPSEQERPSHADSGRTYTRNRESLAVSAPTCVTNSIFDLVPKKWIIEAVRQEASGRWSTFSIGTPIPCADTEGELVCYQVPVAVGTNGFPRVLTPPPASEISPTDLGNVRLWETEKYWTFDVSARRSRYPIPHYRPGLPNFLVTYHKAVELAQVKLGYQRVWLAHYYSLGPSGDYYDFLDESGGRVLINARNLQCHEMAAGTEPFAATKVSSSKVAATKTPEELANLRRDHERQAKDAWDKISNGLREKGN